MSPPRCLEQFKPPTLLAEEIDFQDLLDGLSYLPEDALRAALDAVADSKDRRAVPALLDLLRTGAADLAHAVAHTIAVVGGRQARLGLQRIAEGACLDQVRLAAVYGLTWLFDEQAFGTLLRLYRNAAEPPEVRAQAAEGLSYLLGHGVADEQPRQSALDPLLAGLDDTSVDVRFWSIHALGALRARPALARLRQLADSDDGHNAAMDWSIRDEAADAIERIEAVSRQFGGPKLATDSPIA